jgi:hypothetical protein
VGSNHRALPILVLLLLGACTFPPLRSATQRPTPTTTPTPEPTVTPSPTVGPSATPDPAAIPDFTAGEIVATAIDGLRVRQRPSLTSVVVAGLLPLGARLEVVMGPIPSEGLGWYLVRDADSADPAFEEGWIAAGYEPEAFLASTGETDAGSPFLASFAQTGDAEYGPISIGEGDHAIRWVAVDPERTRCDFAVSLTSGSGEPVPAIRATIGNDLVPGTLQPGSFDALGVRGEVFVSVVSDCAWTLVVERVPELVPSPSP